jgi:hypothetical protein
MQDVINSFKMFWDSSSFELFSNHPKNDEINEYLYNLLTTNGNFGSPIDVVVPEDSFAITKNDEYFDSAIVLYAKLVGLATSTNPLNPFQIKLCVEMNGLKHYLTFEEANGVPHDQLIVEVWWK